MKEFIQAFFLVVVIPLGGVEGYNSLAQLYWSNQCKVSHFDGARAASIGIWYGGWQCYVRGEERWYEVDADRRVEWELEAMNKQKEK